MRLKRPPKRSRRSLGDGKYISLVASIKAGRVVDVPTIVCAPYSNYAAGPRADETAVTINVNAATQSGEYMYVTGTVGTIGNWDTDLGLPVDPASYPTSRNNVNQPSGKAFSTSTTARRPKAPLPERAAPEAAFAS